MNAEDFERIKEQENNVVKFWFEHKTKDIIISLVSCDNSHPDAEVRITGDCGRMIIPMSMSIFKTISPEKTLSGAVMVLNRN